MKRNVVLVSTIIATVTVIFCSIYIIGQQTIRLSANLPLVQTANEVANKLTSGQSANVAISNQTGIVQVYNQAGDLLSTTSAAGNSVIPKGVLENANKGTNAVTWVPTSGERLASVTIKAGNNYVVAAQPLNEPEKLITTIGKLTFFGYIVTLIVIFVGYILFMRTPKAKQKV